MPTIGKQSVSPHSHVFSSKSTHSREVLASRAKLGERLRGFPLRDVSAILDGCLKPGSPADLALKSISSQRKTISSDPHPGGSIAQVRGAETRELDRVLDRLSDVNRWSSHGCVVFLQYGVSQ